MSISEKEERKEIKHIEQGEEMKRLLDSPVFREAFSELQDRYFLEFQDADSGAARKAVWVKQKVLTDLAAHLRRVYDRGEDAKAVRLARLRAIERQERTERERTPSSA